MHSSYSISFQYHYASRRKIEKKIRENIVEICKIFSSMDSAFYSNITSLYIAEVEGNTDIFMTNMAKKYGRQNILQTLRNI